MGRLSDDAQPAGTGTYAPLVADWTASTAYTVGQLVTNGGQVYRVSTAHTSTGSFDATKFTSQGGTSVAYPNSSGAATVVARPFGWYDVRDYGAKLDGATDDAAALQAAVNAAIAAGGGSILIPQGTGTLYLPSAPTTGTGGGGYAYSGQILIPARAVASKPITLRFLGTTPQTTVFFGSQVGDNIDVEAGGSIIQSTATSGNIIDVIPHGTANALGDYWTNINVEVENLLFRAPNNPFCGGLRLHKALYASIDRCTIGVNATTQSLSQPTHSTVALTLPQVNNGARVEFRRSQVYGFDTGIQHSEHTVLDNVAIYHCNVGIAPQLAYHPSTYYRVGLWRNPVHIRPAAQCYITGVIGLESGSTGWYATTLDIDDLNGYLYGDLKFTRFSTARIATRGGQDLNLHDLRSLPTGRRPSLLPAATSDDFTGDNTLTGIGQMSSGQTWVPTTGNWGITSNKAYLSSTAVADAICTVNTLHPTVNLASYTVQADVTLSGTAALAGLVVHQNGTTWMTIMFRKYGANNVLRLEKRTSGTYATLTDAMSGTVVNGTTYTLTVRVTTTQIIVGVNDPTLAAPVITYTKTGGEQTTFNSNTKCGLSSYGSGGEDGGSRWSKFSVV